MFELHECWSSFWTQSHVFLPWAWSCVWAGCVRVELAACPRGGTAWSTHYRSWTCSQRNLWWPPEPEEVCRTDTWLPCCRDSLCACTCTYEQRKPSVIYWAFKINNVRLIWKVNTCGLGYMYACLFNLCTWNIACVCGLLWCRCDSAASTQQLSIKQSIQLPNFLTISLLKERFNPQVLDFIYLL